MTAIDRASAVSVFALLASCSTVVNSSCEGRAHATLLCEQLNRGVVGTSVHLESLDFGTPGDELWRVCGSESAVLYLGLEGSPLVQRDSGACRYLVDLIGGAGSSFFVAREVVSWDKVLAVEDEPPVAMGSSVDDCNDLLVGQPLSLLRWKSDSCCAASDAVIVAASQRRLLVYSQGDGAGHGAEDLIACRTAPLALGWFNGYRKRIGSISSVVGVAHGISDGFFWVDVGNMDDVDVNIVLAGANGCGINANFRVARSPGLWREWVIECADIALDRFGVVPGEKIAFELSDGVDSAGSWSCTATTGAAWQASLLISLRSGLQQLPERTSVIKVSVVRGEVVE